MGMLARLRAGRLGTVRHKSQLRSAGLDIFS